MARPTRPVSDSRYTVGTQPPGRLPPSPAATGLFMLNAPLLPNAPTCTHARTHVTHHTQRYLLATARRLAEPCPVPQQTHRLPLPAPRPTSSSSTPDTRSEFRGP